MLRGAPLSPLGPKRLSSRLKQRRPSMPRANGLHHLAISTGNMKAQIEYFSDVLGMELVALYWMHGVAGTWHGFLRLNDHASVAFVQNDAIKATKAQLG